MPIYFVLTDLAGTYLLGVLWEYSPTLYMFEWMDLIRRQVCLNFATLG